MKLCKALVRGLGSSSRQYSNPISNTQRRSCIIERNPTTEDDWVILGHIDRAMPFEPTKDLGPSVLRAETEMYHLYRKIKDGDADWLEMVDLFCCCDQELVSTAYMWSMYLEVIPTLFGAKREFARLFHYHHQFDISVFNALLKQFVSNGSFLEAGRLWQKSILRSNKLITEPNVHTLNIMLDMVLTPSPEEEEWWLDRGVLFVPSERKRASFFRPKILDSVSTKKLTTGDQFNMVGQCFQAIERYKIEPDFTTLYLMARVIRVEIDYGRHIASQICMYMETLNDDVVPVEARLLISEFLHWKLENVELDSKLSVMAGARITTREKFLVFFDDCKNALSYNFRTSDHIPQVKPMGKNQVKIELQ